MSAERVLVWGASGHARVVADMLRQDPRYDIAGFIDDTEDRTGELFAGATVLGGRDAMDAARQGGIAGIVIAVGDCGARVALAAEAVARGFRLLTVVHPSAQLAPDVQLGDGTVIAAGAIINTGSTIGANVIINTGAIVDHDCRIADGVHVGPGACLGGRVSVGVGTWLGIGAVVIDRRSVGAGTIVGAGAIVVRDIPDGVVAYGNPARVVRKVSA